MQQPKNGRPGLIEVAEKAGLSLSTVKRVLNEYGSVSDHSRQRIIAAATELGIKRLLPPAWHGSIRIEIILPRNSTPQWQTLDKTFMSIAATLPRNITIHRTFVPQNNIEALRRAIVNPGAKRNALIIAADAADEVRPWIIEVMNRQEVVITLTTKVPGLPQHPFSGIDNVAAGRTAGYVMSQILDHHGEIIVLKANDRREEHESRVRGFMEVIKGVAPVSVFVTDEIDGRTKKYLASRFEDTKVAGIYASEHNPEEVAGFLRHRKCRPKWVSHDLSGAHYQYLREGLMDFVIDQDPTAQAAWAIAKALEAFGVDSTLTAFAKPPTLGLYCRENLPEELVCCCMP